MPTPKNNTVKKVLIATAKNHITSLNSKMPCRTWDLEAGDTCPGSLDSNGVAVPACSKCYAKKGFFTFPAVRQTRMNNKLAWQNIDWVDEMVSELKKDTYFRFFGSGDGYALALWEKIYEIAIRSPHCRIWIPTRMFKFPKFREVIDKLNSLDNVVVRFSSDSITGQIIDGDQTSTIISNPDELKSNIKLCSSYKNNGKCGECRSCWAKICQVVAYKLH